MDALEMLDQLDELYAQRDALALQKEEAIAKVMPPEVREALADIDVEFNTSFNVVNDKISGLEGDIRGEVKQTGVTVKGSHFQAVYAKGRVTWDTKALDGYAAGHPEINQFRKEGDPSVSIRRV